jgi:hypothetical protein
MIIGPHRVFPGRLSVSRTIGDIEAKDPRYGGKVHIVKEIYGKNTILDNDKKYVRSQLLKVPANSESYDKPNMIQKIKTRVI